MDNNSDGISGAAAGLFLLFFFLLIAGLAGALTVITIFVVRALIYAVRVGWFYKKSGEDYDRIIARNAPEIDIDNVIRATVPGAHLSEGEVEPFGWLTYRQNQLPD